MLETAKVRNLLIHLLMAPEPIHPLREHYYRLEYEAY